MGIGKRGIKIGVCFAVMVWGLIGESMAETAPDPCISVITTMLPCLPFVTGDSVTPTAGCCTAFSGVLQSRPDCLCVVLKGGSPLPLNQTLALELPNACKVKTPPVTDCNKASGNESVTSPSPSSTPTVPTPPSGGTNTRDPSPSQSGGNTIIIMPYNIQIVASFLLAIILLKLRSDQFL